MKYNVLYSCILREVIFGYFNPCPAKGFDTVFHLFEAEIAASKYERVYLPIYNVADTPSHIQGPNIINRESIIMS